MQHAQRQPKSNHRGLTLIELMVTIAILGILASLAIPGFQFFLNKSTAASITTDFARDVGRIRIEAISRNQCVTMCQSTNADEASPTCVGSGSDWNRGWIMFVNPACSATVNASTAATPVFAVRDVGDTRFTLQPASGSALRKIMADPRGMTSIGSSGRTFTLAFTPETVSSPHYRSLCLSSAGRTVIKKYAGTAACS